jgi:DNA-binding LytR/AlgR family response regulator
MRNEQILIVEDEPLFAIDLERMLDELGFTPVATLDNAEDVLRTLKKNKVDLILMDISINGELSGIELAEKISHLKIPIVFLTAHNDAENYKKAKAAGMHAYLIKPFNRFTLESVIDSALAQEKKGIPEFDIEETITDSLFLRANNKLQRVKFSEITYIVAEGNYVEIVSDKRKYAFKISLRRLQERLANPKFLQIHRSYLINIDHIKNVDLSRNMIQVKDHSLPVGGSFKESILKRLNLL